MKELIIREIGEKAYSHIKGFVDFECGNILVVSTSSIFNIENSKSDLYDSIVNLKKVNDIRHINRLFRAVNSKLNMGGRFVVEAETFMLRRTRILKAYVYGLNYIVFAFDYLIRNILLKIPFYRKRYMAFTGGMKRIVPRAEILGRLYYSGFKVIDEEIIDGIEYFIAEKNAEPKIDYKPYYSPIIGLTRLGKNGKKIKVYKIRTMYAYSQYIQEYVYDKEKLKEGGKFSNDYRITPVGRFLRKLWLDELPMLFNLLKGDIKLVGVRPISEHYFSLYPEDYRKRRLKYKPGLIPPFYVDMPKNLEEIVSSEKRFLDLYDEKPFKTNWKYFWQVMRNIFIGKVRSE